MWHDTPLEAKLKKAFSESKNDLIGWDNFIPSYDATKQYLDQNLFQDIARREPMLTDHGRDHIQNVLHNANSILVSSSASEYSPQELYILCMCILVHDIGNLSSRKGHENKISEYFNDQTSALIQAHTRRTIISIACAHGGTGDTIKKILPRTDLNSQPISAHCIAAVVRFADELAEGPQRTSTLLLEKGVIAPESELFHLYSNYSTSPCIEGNAVVIGYHIPLIRKIKGKQITETHETIRKILSMVLMRAHKLNWERIYCGMYSNHLRHINQVNISISFYSDIESLDLVELPLELTSMELTNLDCKKLNLSETLENKSELISQIIDALDEVGAFSSQKTQKADTTEPLITRVKKLWKRS